MLRQTVFLFLLTVAFAFFNGGHVKLHCIFSNYMLNFFQLNEKYFILSLKQNVENISIMNHLKYYGKSLQSQNTIILSMLEELRKKNASTFPADLMTVNLYLNNVMGHIYMYSNTDMNHDETKISEEERLKLGFKTNYNLITNYLMKFISEECGGFTLYFVSLEKRFQQLSNISKYCENPLRIENIETVYKCLLEMENNAIEKFKTNIDKFTYSDFHPSNLLFFNLLNPYSKFNNEEVHNDGLSLIRSIKINDNLNNEATIITLYEKTILNFDSYYMKSFQQQILVATIYPVFALMISFLDVYKKFYDKGFDITYSNKFTFLQSSIVDIIQKLTHDQLYDYKVNKYLSNLAHQLNYQLSWFNLFITDWIQITISSLTNILTLNRFIVNVKNYQITSKGDCQNIFEILEQDIKLIKTYVDTLIKKKDPFLTVTRSISHSDIFETSPVNILNTKSTGSLSHYDKNLLFAEQSSKTDKNSNNHEKKIQKDTLKLGSNSYNLNTSISKTSNKLHDVINSPYKTQADKKHSEENAKNKISTNANEKKFSNEEILQDKNNSPQKTEAGLITKDVKNMDILKSSTNERVVNENNSAPQNLLQNNILNSPNKPNSVDNSINSTGKPSNEFYDVVNYNLYKLRADKKHSEENAKNKISTSANEKKFSNEEILQDENNSPQKTEADLKTEYVKNMDISKSSTSERVVNENKFVLPQQHDLDLSNKPNSSINPDNPKSLYELRADKYCVEHNEKSYVHVVDETTHTLNYIDERSKTGQSHSDNFKYNSPNTYIINEFNGDIVHEYHQNINSKVNELKKSLFNNYKSNIEKPKYSDRIGALKFEKIKSSFENFSFDGSYRYPVEIEYKIGISRFNELKTNIQNRILNNSFLNNVNAPKEPMTFNQNQQKRPVGKKVSSLIQIFKDLTQKHLANQIALQNIHGKINKANKNIKCPSSHVNNSQEIYNNNVEPNKNKQKNFIPKNKILVVADQKDTYDSEVNENIDATLLHCLFSKYILQFIQLNEQHFITIHYKNKIGTFTVDNLLYYYSNLQFQSENILAMLEELRKKQRNIFASDLMTVNLFLNNIKGNININSLKNEDIHLSRKKFIDNYNILTQYLLSFINSKCHLLSQANVDLRFKHLLNEINKINNTSNHNAKKIMEDLQILKYHGYTTLKNTLDKNQYIDFYPANMLFYDLIFGYNSSVSSNIIPAKGINLNKLKNISKQMNDRLNVIREVKINSNNKNVKNTIIESFYCVSLNFKAEYVKSFQQQVLAATVYPVFRAICNYLVTYKQIYTTNNNSAKHSESITKIGDTLISNINTFKNLNLFTNKPTNYLQKVINKLEEILRIKSKFSIQATQSKLISSLITMCSKPMQLNLLQFEIEDKLPNKITEIKFNDALKAVKNEIDSIRYYNEVLSLHKNTFEIVKRSVPHDDLFEVKPLDTILHCVIG
ncbi:putative uncharacterized protein DDB_G0282133 [Daktulosphaira vitifoliae]|uniref:putative uncharacterized protein DDB_G0282133 n=1 Tax=Daktulosphaira vitifoliae TaxID=58002 RepID=UPI0021AB016A|nr:putative uncharacterized protein DDB_G0282133 [Daktulosphaira vitifoliae]